MEAPAGRTDVHGAKFSESAASRCFATALLFNLDDVRANCASSLTAHGNLVAMLKSRVNLERTYAHELSKMARHSRLDETEHGTMKLAMGSLRAQYLNTSVQHQQLAKSLEEDVLRPIELLYEYSSQRAQSLTRRINNVKKEAKAQEDTYRRDYSAFDKTFKEASTSFSAAMDSGFSSTLLEEQYHRRLSQMEASSTPPKKPHSTIRHDKAAGTVALKSINNNKLVSWLLSSETHRKEDLANSTVKLMEAAEKSRRKCQQTWQDVETHRIKMYRAVQAVLADYQQIAEDRIFTIATSLRKHVIFSASALANEQYDWQVISAKFESVDLKSAIQDFIRRCHATRGAEERLALEEMTVNDLCSNTSQTLVASPASKPCRPLRKTCLEIRDVSSKKIPFDYDGNQELLCDALSVRPRASAGAQCHQRRGGRDHTERSREEYARLRIDTSSSKNGLVADGEPSAAPPAQASDVQVGVAMEYKSFIQDEPEHDSDEATPSVSPSGSSASLVTHFTGQDHEGESMAAADEEAGQAVQA